VSDELFTRIQRSFERQGFMQLLGAKLTDVAPGRVVITLPNSEKVSQQLGYVHAGATSAIGDTAAGYSALTLLPVDVEVLTVEYKINLLAPGAGDSLEAVGTVVKSGRTLSVCRFDVVGIRGSERTTVAAGQVTLIAVASTPSS
jgi:uncharacterized protein (TIGR00369 family)